jgi:hypothetical protein
MKAKSKRRTKKEAYHSDEAFQEGDIVLAKCPGQSPEPAIIQFYRGIDAHQQEVYKVKFIPGDNWAYLPSSYMHHLTLKTIS